MFIYQTVNEVNELNKNIFKVFKKKSSLAVVELNESSEVR